MAKRLSHFVRTSRTENLTKWIALVFERYSSMIWYDMLMDTSKHGTPLVDDVGNNFHLHDFACQSTIRAIPIPFALSPFVVYGRLVVCLHSFQHVGWFNLSLPSSVLVRHIFLHQCCHNFLSSLVPGPGMANAAWFRVCDGTPLKV